MLFLMYARPPHLRRRQTTGRTFGTDAELVRLPTSGAGAGRRNAHGEWVNATEPAPVPIRLSTTVGTAVSETRRRELTEDGFRLEAIRLFYTQEPVTILSARHVGDIIIYPPGETRWRAVKSSRYHALNEIVGELIERQGLPDGTDPIGGEPALADQLRDLQRLIRAYIAFGSGIPRSLCIPAKDTGPVPDELFASVLVTHNDERSFPNYHEAADPSEDGFFHDLVDITRDAMVRIAWRRRGAEAAALQFGGWLETTQARELEHQVGFQLLEPYHLREAGEVVSDAWEESALMDLHIGFAQHVDESIAAVESVLVRIDLDHVQFEQEIRYGTQP